MAEIDDLKGWYRQGLIARISALEAGRKALAEDKATAIESIRRIAHSLGGSGATYGFPDITEAARALEKAPEPEIPAMTERLIVVLRRVTAREEERKSTILVIDNDPQVGAFLEATLAAPDREIKIVGGAATAQQILEEQEVGLVILDIVLPDMDGRSLLLSLRERPATAGLPVFVISSLRGSHPRTECFALGADEYFEKPLDPKTLAAAATSKLQRSAELLRGSRRDPLTGLPNRAAFKEAFGRARLLAVRYQKPLSLAILDLDYFKQINDTYGHPVGDEVLRGTAEVISRSLRRSDLVARWGGEEFVVLFPNTESADGVRTLQKVLDALHGERFQAPGSRDFQVTFSAGVAQVSDGASSESAIAEADRFLYQAKAAGRNRISPGSGEIRLERKKILFAEDDELIATVVKRALTDEGFQVLHFPDGVSALAAARETHASLVLLDVVMPEMGGFELLENLRRIPAYAPIPIVMLTAMGSEQDIVRGFDLGADDYVVKPFSLPELVARVRRLIKH